MFISDIELEGGVKKPDRCPAFLMVMGPVTA